MNLEEEKNKLVVSNKIEELIELINNSDYELINAIKVYELVESVEKLTPDIKEKINKDIETIVEVFIKDRHIMTNTSLNRAYDCLENIKREFKLIEMIKDSNRKAAETKSSLERREEQYRADEMARQNRIFLSELKNKYGEQVYSIDDLDRMSYSELADLVYQIKNAQNKTNEYSEQENELEEEKDPEEDSNIIEEVDYEPTIPKAIEKLIENIDPENMTPEQIQQIIEKVEEFIMMIYDKEQLEFENDLKKLTTVDDKIEMVAKRERDIVNYCDYMKHDDQKINDLLFKNSRSLMEKIATKYRESKLKGEYCWKEVESITQSKNYINSVIGDREDLIQQFSVLIDNMKNLIKSPTKKEYKDWQSGMTEFAKQTGLEPEKMTPYLTANAKLINDKLSVDKEFNIVGLNLEKNRRKVTKVEPKGKVKEFFKRHPALKLIAVGLAVGLASQLGLGALMMINSSLWTVLGGQGAICSALHAINLGLSKVVGGSLFKFTTAGTYTFLGQTGALNLYSAVGAKITTALAGLGGIGAAIANKIKKKNKNKTEELETKKKRKWFQRKEREEIEEPSEEAELEKETPEEEKTDKTQEALIEFKEKIVQQSQWLKNAIDILEKQGYSREEAKQLIKEGLTQTNEQEETIDRAPKM